jgi:hypothetical protein
LLPALFDRAVPQQRSELRPHGSAGEPNGFRNLINCHWRPPQQLDDAA